MHANYVLIDYENVQPESLERLTDENLKVVVFVGASQARLPYELAEALQRMGSRAEYVKISGNGSNALDFHIAYYIGKFAAEDPQAQFQIVSKDAGFDPLIQHLQTKKIRARRIDSLTELRGTCGLTRVDPRERQQVVVTKLQSLKSARPRTVKALSNAISATFHKSLTDKEIASLVQSLSDRGLVKVEGSKVAYELPAG